MVPQSADHVPENLSMIGAALLIMTAGGGSHPEQAAKSLSDRN
jgi:hypothetical protein